MKHRRPGWSAATWVSGCVLATLAVAAGAAPASGDAFSAMRVRRIAPPVPAGNLVLQGMDGRPIPLSTFRGKAVLLEFFLPT